MNKKIAVFAGDGIGPEVMDEALKVLHRVNEKYALGVEIEKGLVGGCAYEKYGTPLPESSLNLAKSADAVMLGAVGGPQWDTIDFSLRPERALLALRGEMDLYANLRPAKVHPALADASTLKREVVDGVDIMVVRELVGGMYFGQPRGVEKLADGSERGINTEVYTTPEIERIAKVAFEVARKRGKKLCSVDKANVLESSGLWRRVVIELGKSYPDVALSHMYVDNCAMQLIRQPKQFDVIVTTNMFGDILSDEASMLTGSIGMLPSASLSGKKGMYEPIHGSAPDIAGQGKANPIATILSVAMMLDYTFDASDVAREIENAVTKVLDGGYRTADIYSDGMKKASTKEMGDLILKAIG